jgi:hypothetical protein
MAFTFTAINKTSGIPLRLTHLWLAPAGQNDNQDEEDEEQDHQYRHCS